MERERKLETLLGDAHEVLARTLDGETDEYAVARVMRQIDGVLRSSCPVRGVVLFDERRVG